MWQRRRVTELSDVDSGDAPRDTTPAIVFGLLPDSGESANVSLAASYGFDNAWVMTYVVELVDGSWTVTGKDAPAGLT